jgi:AraC-like DNA-binding protein
MNLTIAAVSIIKLLNYKKQIKSSDSTLQQFDLRWIFTVLLGFTVVFIFEGMKYVYYFKTDSYLRLTDTIHYVKFIVFSSLMFSGLKTSNLFDVAQNRTKYSKSPLMKNEKEILLEKLKGLMNKEKYYLTPSITIQNVGEKLNEQPRYISQVINELLEQNFIDFVNSYRIEEARNMLIDPKYNKMSIQGIMFECGFNSKSAFNTAFRKQTGKTPKEFRTIQEKNGLV